MRIRKRFPPPSAPSDLHLSRSAAAQPKSDAAQTTDIPPGQLSDEVVMAISDSNTRWAQPEDDNNGVKMKLKESGDDETWKEEQKKKLAGDDIRANNIPSEEECTNNTFMQPSSSSSSAKDTKSLVPLKKRRGCFERSPKEETQMNARMKSKTNKKCDLSTQTDQDVAQNINHMSSSGTGTKKSKRGNVIMEGSRCSRVNGRGWRCCQPTLVGYALCEHHLGKGRVRSMSSTVRRRHEDDEVDRRGGAQPLSSGDLGLQQPLVVTKRRTKVGVVKARSISSLLSQV
ncbi:uncharacterized protein [Henckelia pumila]|uniref:uncharacterized protein isoform X2 n=1 Tax=Henckelia pumila TaxID=405737 RepID=UPI003C6E3EBD